MERQVSHRQTQQCVVRGAWCAVRETRRAWNSAASQLCTENSPGPGCVHQGQLTCSSWVSSPARASQPAARTIFFHDGSLYDEVTQIMAQFFPHAGRSCPRVPPGSQICPEAREGLTSCTAAISVVGSFSPLAIVSECNCGVMWCNTPFCMASGCVCACTALHKG